jgi:SAM-dependent methyltransferase
MKPSPSRLLLAATLAAALGACATQDTGDATYRPWLGQAGKDVMWVPTLDTLVMPMLEAAAVTKDDVVYDLGSGDGKIPIWAARRFGARAVGIEYDPKLSALAQRNAERAGVTDRVRMVTGDIFKEDFSSATVVTLYLGRDLNLKLRPTLLAMRPGTRVVSNSFDMDTWEPDRTIRIPEQNPVFLWIVPARVEGEWEVTGLPDARGATLRLAQAFQKVSGTLSDGARTLGAVQGRLDGTRLALEIAGAPGTAPRRIEASVDGGTLRGDAAAGGPGITARRLR